MSVIRVRFAPSPTGSLHVGNLRTALFNWLYARKHCGVFILRIEDTDTARSTREAEEELLRSMRMLGLDWDEGPDIGGPHAPYRQSERAEKYREAVERLLDAGHVYPCYCSAEELETERKKQSAAGQPPRYQGKCRNISAGVRAEFEKRGVKPSYRFRVEKDAVEFHDGVRGNLRFMTRDIGDFIVTRSDGTAAYYLASALDDIDMEITDVIRGEDHLSNTPKQLLLLKALGASAPNYYHMPMILDKQGRKLSKREGAVNVAQLLADGYLPDAILTSIAMLGWSGVTGKEAETLAMLTEKFDINRVSRAPAHFDAERLEHVNMRALKSLSAEEFGEVMRMRLQEAGFPFDKFTGEKFSRVMTAVKESIHSPNDTGFIASQFAGKLPPDEEARAALSEPGAEEAVAALRGAVGEMNGTGETDYHTVMNTVTAATGLKGKKLYTPIRAALTGRTSGPNLKDIFEVLGAEGILERLTNKMETDRS